MVVVVETQVENSLSLLLSFVILYVCGCKASTAFTI